MRLKFQYGIVSLANLVREQTQGSASVVLLAILPSQSYGALQALQKYHKHTGPVQLEETDPYQILISFHYGQSTQQERGLEVTQLARLCWRTIDG